MCKCHKELARPACKPQYNETHTEYLKRKAKMVGHWAMSKWMLSQGYSFKYTYFVIFGRYPNAN